MKLADLEINIEKTARKKTVSIFVERDGSVRVLAPADATDEKIEQANHAREEGEHVHHQADGLDWAHLTIELGLVLCTVSILTKKKIFWVGGIISALAGAGLAASALGLLH